MIHELTPLFSAHPFSQQIKHTSQGLSLSLSFSASTQNNNVKNEPLHHPLIIMLDRIQSLFWVNNSFYPFIVSYSLIKTHTTWPLATTESSRGWWSRSCRRKIRLVWKITTIKRLLLLLMLVDGGWTRDRREQEERSERNINYITWSRTRPTTDTFVDGSQHTQ